MESILEKKELGSLAEPDRHCGHRNRRLLFIKAFENNWIGPGGRIVIGLLAANLMVIVE